MICKAVLDRSESTGHFGIQVHSRNVDKDLNDFPELPIDKKRSNSYLC